MKFKYSYFKNAVFLLLAIALFSSVLMAQKKPTTLKLDVDTDDLQLCGSSSISNSQFCVLFRSYYSKLNSGNFAGAQADRNEMIEIVRGQVDIFYKQRKDGRSSKIRVFSSVLDFLRIGGELAVTIMNGERAKTIVGAALGGLNSGQSAFNKNFQILQTQVLINKMNANRAEIMTEIQTKKALEPGDYSWYSAKNDLRRYLFAGTFDNALDTLVIESGEDVKTAERTLKIVEARAIVPAATVGQLVNARTARDAKNAIRNALNSGDDIQIQAATVKLQNVMDDLDEDDDLNALFTREGISKTTADGQEIFDKLQLLIEELPETNGRKGRELVDKINQAFIRNQ